MPLFTRFIKPKWLIPVGFLICIQLNWLMTSQLFVELDWFDRQRRRAISTTTRELHRLMFLQGVLLWLPPCKLKLTGFNRLPLVKWWKIHKSSVRIVCFHSYILSACCWPRGSTPELATFVLLVNRCSTAKSGIVEICSWMASQIPNPTRPTSCFTFHCSSNVWMLLFLFFVLAISRPKNTCFFLHFFSLLVVGVLGWSVPKGSRCNLTEGTLKLKIIGTPK